MANVETEVEVETHWGAKFGWGIRWNPSYGSGFPVPYTEKQARMDATNNDGVVVKRVVTTVVVTTPWEEV